MKLALISLKSESSRLIYEEAKKYFSSVSYLNLKDIETRVDSDGTRVLYKGKAIQEQFDAVYCRGSHKFALLLSGITEALGKNAYVPVPPNAFIFGHNKFLTHLELQKARIPMPRSYLVADIKAAKAILNEIHYPIIIKIPSGTHGKGVMFADSIASASSVLDALEVFKQPFIIQEYIETGATDTRAIVVGDRVVAAMKRKAINGELRANIHMGGVGIPVELDNVSWKIAVKAAKAMGVDIAAVDLLEGYKTMVIEVNLSPGLSGVTRTTKVNVANEIAKFLFKRAKEFKEKRVNKGYRDILNGINKSGELISNLDIKLGRIRLPSFVTRMCGITEDDDVLISVCNGKIVIKKQKIGD